MKLIIGADIVPTKNNISGFLDGDKRKLICPEVENILNEAEYRIFNLETPLTDTISPIKKCGPNHATPLEAINGINALGVDFLTLANNHILDQGSQGLMSSQEILRKNNIAFAGVGHRRAESNQPFILDRGNEFIGIYCCAEHEFTICTNNSAGANPYDPLESFDSVQTMSNKCNYNIVLFHGGKEYYQYPSPDLQKICRKFIGSGADLVVCQHSHCIGSYEKYLDGEIIYGQGNFLFEDENNEMGNNSLLIGIDTKTRKVNYTPVMNIKGVCCIADYSSANRILSEFEMRSKDLSSLEKIQENYDKFANKKVNDYLRAFLGTGTRGFWFKVFNKISRGILLRFVINRKYKIDNILALRNYIECEAHREVIISALKNRAKDLS